MSVAVNSASETKVSDFLTETAEFQTFAQIPYAGPSDTKKPRSGFLQNFASVASKIFGRTPRPQYH